MLQFIILKWTIHAVFMVVIKIFVQLHRLYQDSVSEAEKYKKQLDICSNELTQVTCCVLSVKTLGFVCLSTISWLLTILP